jgi:hypothetical protein
VVLFSLLSASQCSFLISASRTTRHGGGKVSDCKDKVAAYRPFGRILLETVRIRSATATWLVSERSRGKGGFMTNLPGWELGKQPRVDKN